MPFTSYNARPGSAFLLSQVRLLRIWEEATRVVFWSVCLENEFPNKLPSFFECQPAARCWLTRVLCDYGPR
jgi:hypothetical protein